MSIISRGEAIDNYQYLNELFISFRKEINEFLSSEIFKINHTDFKNSIMNSVNSEFKVKNEKDRIYLLLDDKFIEFDLYEGFIILHNFKENISLMKEKIDIQKSMIENKLDTKYKVNNRLRNKNKKFNNEIAEKNDELNERIKLGIFTNALLNMLKMPNSFKLKEEIDELNKSIEKNNLIIENNDSDIKLLEENKKDINKYDFRFTNDKYLFNKINEFAQYFKNEYGFEFYIKNEII
ncbi:hypothetical protein [Staphylococcus phage LY01]|nr:hypothetical protein [Staphylococcus phage LY01]